MGIGYKDIAGEPVGVFSDIADMAFVGSRTAKKRRRKHRRVSKSSRRPRARSSPKRRRKSSHSRGGIKYTKRGQPYRIMSNGRARFLKKR